MGEVTEKSEKKNIGHVTQTWQTHDNELIADMQNIYFLLMQDLSRETKKQENNCLFTISQGEQHWSKESSTANIVLFSTNQIADILYISDNDPYHSYVKLISKPGNQFAVQINWLICKASTRCINGCIRNGIFPCYLKNTGIPLNETKNPFW